MVIYEDKDFYIKEHQSEIPWLIIFTQEHYKELGDMPPSLRLKLWALYDKVEDQMRHYYKPDKINMASFGNMLPRVHLHVMARFKNDSYFPNPMWGEKTQAAKLDLANKEEFYAKLYFALQNGY